MNDLTDFLTKEFKPRLAIIAYTPDGDDSWKEPYLESHEVDSEGRFLASKPLKAETIQGMVDVFFDERKSQQDVKGWFPETLLQFSHIPGGKYGMIWYRPEEKRFIHFSESLKIKSGLAWVPPMIYVTDGKNLRVFATNAKGRPNETTKLFRAPFHNVNEDGDVCIGTAKAAKPTNTYQSILNYWEEIFWKSEFSHLNGSNPTKSNLDRLWRRLLKDNTLKWSKLAGELKGSKFTIKSISK